MSFSKNNPFLASIKDRYSLCVSGSKKNTQHVVLDLQGSGLNYQVGDSLGVYPSNDIALVQKTLASLNATGSEVVVDRQGTPHTLFEFFLRKANIADISRKLFLHVLERQSNSRKKALLDNLLQEQNKEQFKEYIESRHLWDFLAEHHESQLSIQDISALLMPLLPRLYSISSSNRFVGDEVHLTVAYVRYNTNGQERYGVCTHYLCQLAPLLSAEVPVYIQPHHGFTLPPPEASMIMVGPGTGVAPFRAFMQERLMENATGKNWLFFGEWNRQHHFFYESFWEDLRRTGKLSIDVAFSRDQEHKIYVQHRLLERGQEVFQWLQDGAYFYVCGDAKKMAKDVEAALLEIIQTHGKMTDEHAKAYLKKLRSDKRYLRDVY